MEAGRLYVPAGLVVRVCHLLLKDIFIWFSMNFAYLDAREHVLQVPTEHLDPLPCELDDKWKNFEKELSEYKLELSTGQRNLTMAMAELTIKREDILHMRSVIDGMTNPRLKGSLVEVVDNHEVEEGIDALTQQCREMMGRVAEMQRVLKETNAERYASFTCFVCMDRLVDLFLDPCGHVMCERCWSRTSNKRECPGCRGAVRDPKKIYTLS
jgi:hypothetical protein